MGVCINTKILEALHININAGWEREKENWCMIICLKTKHVLVFLLCHNGIIKITIAVKR